MPHYISNRAHDPYPAVIGCECPDCNQARIKEKPMPKLPDADDILRAVAHIQDGRQIESTRPFTRWYDTTNGVENAVPVVDDYAADSYAAGWDTACYAAGNSDAETVSSDALDIEEYLSGLFAAFMAAEGGVK